MGMDFQDGSTRSAVVKHIKLSQEERDRRQRSKMEFDIYSERQKPYVRQYLNQEFGTEAAHEMPMIHAIPICKRIVDQEASIYKMEPKRTFHNVSEEQEAKIQDCYNAFKADTVLARSNAFFKLQSQNHLQLIVKKGKFVFRSLLNHYLSAVPDTEDPTEAQAYVMSVLDLSAMNFGHTSTDKLRGTATNAGLYGDGINQPIGDQDDYRAHLDRYVLWTPEFNAILDKDGKVVSEDGEGNPDMATPIPGFMPFIDVAMNKDWTYWVHAYNSTPDFSIQYNGSMSDANHVVRNQGWAQPVFTGSEYSIPKIKKVGPTYAIHLVTDPEKPEDRPDFKYESPQADIAGTLAFQEQLLANFLSAKGIDPKTISGKAEGTTYNSGMERLLAQIDQFSASRADFALYREVESKLFDLFKAWQNEAGDLLDDKYRTGPIPEDAYVEIEFGKPELVRTEKEKAEDVVYRLDNGLMTRIEAIQELRGVDRESAEAILEEIESERMERAAQVIDGMGQGGIDGNIDGNDDSEDDAGGIVAS